MPKTDAKPAIPPETETDYEKARALWMDFATRLGDQVTHVLKNRAEYQRQIYLKWMEYLRTQGIGNEDKLLEVSQEYDKLYRNWVDFADKTGARIRETMIQSWNEYKDRMPAWQEIFKNGNDNSPINIFEHGREMADKLWSNAKNLISLPVSGLNPQELNRQIDFPKSMFENWVKMQAESMEVLLKSPAFVALLGTMLDSTLDMRKKSEEQTAEIIRSIGLPSRKEMDSLYRKIHELTLHVREQNRIIHEMKNRVSDDNILKDKTKEYMSENKSEHGNTDSTKSPSPQFRKGRKHKK